LSSADSLVENLKSTELKTGDTFLQKFFQMLLGQLPPEDMGVDKVKLFMHKLFKKGVSDQRFLEGLL
jgi:hypothetical protein